MTTRCLTVTDGGSVGACGRLKASSADFWEHYKYSYAYLLSYLNAHNKVLLQSNFVISTLGLGGWPVAFCIAGKARVDGWTSQHATCCSCIKFVQRTRVMHPIK